jgi:antitoxin component YwqK of YwqJK toxin-antitoxin module
MKGMKTGEKKNGFWVYYYEDGTIQQKGTFNAKGKLHGTWTSYDINGEKLAVGNYLNGKKTGKWFFWTNNSLKEVDYIDSKISTVNEWKDKTKLAVRNKK